MAGSARWVGDRAWVRDGERRSKCSGERLPMVQSRKKQGKRPGKEAHLNTRLWAGLILAEQRRWGGYATAAQMLHAAEQCGARGRWHFRIWWRRLRRKVGCGGGPGARLKGKAGPRHAGLREGRDAGITAENLGWLLLRSASVKGGFALWGRDVKEGARQQASRAAGVGSGLGPRAAGLGRVSRGAGGGRGRTLLAGRGCQRPSG